MGALLVVGLLWFARTFEAEPRAAWGSWVEPVGDVSPERWPTPPGMVEPVRRPRSTGGRFWYDETIRIPSAGIYVIDFAGSTTLANFRHLLFDAAGKLVVERAGGIASREENPFLLRHGRDVWLTAGTYHLRTELRSPFLLGHPQPYVESLRAYQRSLKSGNIVALLSLGVLLGLGFCYAALARSRHRRADVLYTLVIAGNVLYNGNTLLLLPELTGIHWYYIISFALLLTNVAYVLFVVALLEVGPSSHPRLHRAAVVLLGLFMAFFVVAAVRPGWSLDLGRFGVSVLTPFAFCAALVRAREGYAPARLYLLAIGAFYVLGALTLQLGNRLGALGLHIEHLGLLASAVEATLLALVLAHRFSVLHAERERAEHRAREGQRIAHSDALTGLPNRSALDASLAGLPEHGSLTFIDLDGLKHYNDKYGHQRGDELLTSFAHELRERLAGDATLFRLGGDEFAITCPSGDVALVDERLAQTVSELRRERFKLAGASAGTVHVHEHSSRAELKHLADTRMYEDKRRRRPSMREDWLRDMAPRSSSRPPPPLSEECEVQSSPQVGTRHR